MSQLFSYATAERTNERRVF